MTGLRFISAAEEQIAPYRFGVYDLLVLPPSFPYGGMVAIIVLGGVSTDQLGQPGKCLSDFLDTK